MHAGIISPPSNQTVALGQSAVFECTTYGAKQNWVFMKNNVKSIFFDHETSDELIWGCSLSAQY